VSLVGRCRRLAKNAILAWQPEAADAAWRVDPRELQGLEIGWPRKLGWVPAKALMEPLLYGFAARATVARRDIPQPLAGTTVIEVRRGRGSYRVALNYSDYPDIIHTDANNGTGTALDLEFKMQYRKRGYGITSVVPGGYVSDSVLTDWYAVRARHERDRQHFQYDVYGRFGLNFATEVRTAALAALTNQSRLTFFGGGEKVGYQQFLREIARARVCLDLPGNGPLCYRLVNYLAVGACIISPPHAAVLPEPLVDRKHIIYTRSDMSDLVDLCERYANDAPARESIAREARTYYRRHLYWRSLSSYYLRTMLDRLPA
jgi:hypothetical protein